jgi:hypothetical protein
LHFQFWALTRSITRLPRIVKFVETLGFRTAWRQCWMWFQPAGWLSQCCGSHTEQPEGLGRACIGEHASEKILDRGPLQTFRLYTLLSFSTVSSLFTLGQIKASGDRADLSHFQHTSSTTVKKPPLSGCFDLSCWTSFIVLELLANLPPTPKKLPC